MASGFPRGSVAKNLPANPGDTGLIPDMGKSHRFFFSSIWENAAEQATKPMCHNY